METVINCLEAKGLPPQKKIHTALNRKEMPFFDSNSIILPNWVPPKQAVNGECYAKTALWNAIRGK